MSKLLRLRGLGAGVVLASALMFAAACGGGGGGGEEGGTGGGTGGGGGEIGGADSLVGAGASFPDPVYQQMFQAYNQEAGVQVEYDPVGSGGGREQFIDGTTDFGGSDDPMSEEAEEQAGGNPQHIPTVGGAVVMAYNVPELEDQTINLTGDAIAQIYLGNITNWNDETLQELNPDVELPDTEITVAHRSDASGTTAIWSTYVAGVSDAFDEQVGAGDELDWPTGVGAQGNQGVTQQVVNTEGAIGYIGLEFAEGEADLPYAAVANTAEGPFIEPSTETASNAIDAVADEIPDDLKLILTELTPEAGGENIYPITSITWLLVRAEMEDLETCRGVANLAWYMTHQGQRFAPEQNYVPLPDSLVEADERQIMEMQAEGEQCYQGATVGGE